MNPLLTEASSIGGLDSKRLPRLGVPHAVSPQVGDLAFLDQGKGKTGNPVQFHLMLDVAIDFHIGCGIRCRGAREQHGRQGTGGAHTSILRLPKKLASSVRISAAVMIFQPGLDSDSLNPADAVEAA